MTKVFFGKIADMVAEVGALAMPQDWLDDCGFKYCVKPDGDQDFETEFFVTLRDAKARAKECAAFARIPAIRI